MRKMFDRLLPIMSLATFLIGGSPVSALTPQDAQQPAPDNSKTNQRDRDQSAATADQQKMNAADRELTRKIRQAISGDKSLSTYAHNIKIIARDGKVTLKGPVRSDDEKTNVLAKANGIAGDGNVTDQMEVAPPKS